MIMSKGTCLQFACNVHTQIRQRSPTLHCSQAEQQQIVLGVLDSSKMRSSNLLMSSKSKITAVSQLVVHVRHSSHDFSVE